MNRLMMTGSIRAALSHFAILGLAAIVTDRRDARARVRWTDDLEPHPALETEVGNADVAECVREHAERHTLPTSWLVQLAATGRREGVGLFAVRTKQPDGPLEWREYASARRRARKSLPLSRLDELLLSALGEPAWWLAEVSGRSPDDGGSRWEMKTRNQGQEFLVHRLAPLARALAKRSAVGVLDGLVGRSLIDETGTGADSRTATGLATPGPVDSAVAWCALWGLHVTASIARLDTVSQTTAVWPRRGVHPTASVLPAFTEPVTPRRFSEVLSSFHFDSAGVAVAVSADGRDVSGSESISWLREQGVRALVKFAIRKTGSASAPERQVLSGHVIPL